VAVRTSVLELSTAVILNDLNDSYCCLMPILINRECKP